MMDLSRLIFIRPSIVMPLICVLYSGDHVMLVSGNCSWRWWWIISSMCIGGVGIVLVGSCGGFHYGYLLDRSGMIRRIPFPVKYWQFLSILQSVCIHYRSLSGSWSCDVRHCLPLFSASLLIVAESFLRIEPLLLLN